MFVSTHPTLSPLTECDTMSIFKWNIAIVWI